MGIDNVVAWLFVVRIYMIKMIHNIVKCSV